MRTTLKDIRYTLASTGNIHSAMVIDKHIEGLFLELTNNLDWDLDTEIDFDEELSDACDPDEQYVSLDYDLTLVPDNDMDVCVRVKMYVDGTQHYETDGYRFIENKSFAVTEIIFDYAGDEWDFTKDGRANKFVNKVLETWI